MTLKIAQEATQSGPQYWKWSTWIAGTAKELDEIEEVVWTLHSTFSNPVRRTKSRKTQFRLDSAGWGEFKIFVEIHLKNGKSRRMSHWLRLRWLKDTLEKSEVPAPSANRAKNSRARQRSVFLSYTKDSASLVRELVDALKGHNINASIDEDIPAGVDFRNWIREKISSSDAVVAIVSNNFGVWQDAEIKAALEANVRLIPVTVGKLEPKISKALKSHPLHSLVSLRAKNGVKIDAEDLAKRINGGIV